MIDKRLKYFCDRSRCLKIRSAKIVILHLNGEHTESEVIKSFPKFDKQGVRNGEIKARQLECGHFISFYTPAFKDIENETLDEFDTTEIRRKIDKEMLGKDKESIGAHILFQVDQYQTLLKIANKQKQQAKYAIQYIDQLKEKYASQLTDEESKKNFDQKFKAFTNEDYKEGLRVERIRKDVNKEVNKVQLAQDKAVEIFAKGMNLSIEDARKMMGLKPVNQASEVSKPVSNVDKMKALLNQENYKKG